MNEFIRQLKGKILIVTVGNKLRGDDGIGEYIFRSLRDKVNADLLNCEDLPENFLEIIINKNPDIIIFIDSVKTGEKPGSILFIEANSLKSSTFFTHKPSLSLSIEYIKAIISCKIFIIGIEAKNTNFGSSISKEVLESADLIGEILIKHIPF